jgi:hypothetical protein
MTNRAMRRVGHSFGTTKEHTANLRLDARMSGPERHPDSSSLHGAWNRTLSRSAPKCVPIQHFGIRLFKMVAQLAFSLFITAGFGAGLYLCTEVNPVSQIFVGACEGIFLWTLALISLGSNRHG